MHLLEPKYYTLEKINKYVPFYVSSQQTDIQGLKINCVEDGTDRFRDSPGPLDEKWPNSYITILGDLGQLFSLG